MTPPGIVLWQIRERALGGHAVRNLLIHRAERGGNEASPNPAREKQGLT
jgi:hypothetical protein